MTENEQKSSESLRVFSNNNPNLVTAMRETGCDPPCITSHELVRVILRPSQFAKYPTSASAIALDMDISDVICDAHCLARDMGI